MKRIIWFVLITLVLAACNQQPQTREQKQQQLEDLKTQRDTLDKQIASLQLQLGNNALQDSMKAVSVADYTLQPSSFKDYIEVQGRIYAQQDVSVTAETAAVVTEIHVQVGDRVHKGEVLAQLDDKVVRQNLNQLQVQLNYTKDLYEKQKNLWEQNIGTQIQLLNAKNNYENVQKQIASIKSQLSTYQITSPIDGTVDENSLKLGQAVSPGIEAFRVVNTRDLRVKAQIGETYASSVDQGDSVIVVFPDANDTLRTKLTYAARTIDPSSRSFNIEIKLPYNKEYRPNMVAVVKVESYKNNNAMVVPIDVVEKTDEGSYVYVNDNNKAKRVNVTVGRIYNGQAEITSGLQKGDKVITAGYQDLTEGEAVKTTETAYNG